MIARAITQPFLSADSNAAAQASTTSKATSRPIGQGSQIHRDPQPYCVLYSIIIIHCIIHAVLWWLCTSKVHTKVHSISKVHGISMSKVHTKQLKYFSVAHESCALRICPSRHQLLPSRKGCSVMTMMPRGHVQNSLANVVENSIGTSLFTLTA